VELERLDPVRWRIPRHGGMRVPGIVFADEELITTAAADRALEQVANVAHLPGIVGASYALPDVHWGYGFPIGGVAATDPSRGGVVSPGGVGFDIGCGVRLLASPVAASELLPHRELLMDELDRRIPRGLGPGAIAPSTLLEAVLAEGAAAAVAAGFGFPTDLDRAEDHAADLPADPDALPPRAAERGRRQLGSLGGGNHFLEVQVVERVIDAVAARTFGLHEGTVAVMIHSGSRGLGHEACRAHLRRIGPAMRRHGITVPDRQLAAVPVGSPEGRDYLGAMAAAANFARANRHLLAAAARSALAVALGRRPEETGLTLVYDVAHNLAELEDHPVAGEVRRLCVHRKGATRAFGPGDPRLPADIRATGQPVLIPGTMGTASWVLRGLEGNPVFASAAHGAGRTMSRTAAKRLRSGGDVLAALEADGIAVRPGATRLLAEEAPEAYKDVDRVVSVCERAGLALPVARLRPLGVVKG